MKSLTSLQSWSARTQLHGSRARHWHCRALGLARLLRQAWLQMVGIPDYERYLEHMASHHPEQTPVSRPQFVRQAIDRKYGRSGPRCC